MAGDVSSDGNCGTGNNILVAVESRPTIKKWAPGNKAIMSDARDDTITTAVAVGISTPRNTVYNLITTL